MIIAISGKIGSGKDTVGAIVQYLIAQSKVDYELAFTIEEFLSGKDIYNINYVKDYQESISGDSGWKIKKFAYKLKQIISILTGISIEDLEKQEVKDRILGEEWWRYKSTIEDNFIISYNDGILKNIHKNPEKHGFELDKLTVRQFLQVLGTEVLRNQLHPNVHVNALFADYVCKGTIHPPRYSHSGYPNWIITDVRFPNELQAVKDRGGISVRVNRHSLQYDAFNEHESEIALDRAEFDYVINNDSDISSLIEKVKEILIKEKII